MCGIGGYFLRPGGLQDKGFLERCRARLGHRGPDGEGDAVADGAGFCHTRLAIIDISGGKQPFIRGDKKTPLMAVANGEIYNHAELRGCIGDKKLLKSNSDCEVLLPLWREHGAEFAGRLRGMYAAALYDGASGRGCLMRDPFGIKPLYYMENENGIFFASEIAALKHAMRVSCEPVQSTAAHILDRQFIMGGATPYDGIKKLGAGEVLTIEAGRITDRMIDNPLDKTPPSSPSNPANLDTLLEQTVEAHQLSDVPFGIFLSGGVDSSVLLAMMARLRKLGRVPDHTPRLVAYTARFDSGGVADESEHAEHLAATCDADFIDVTYGERDFLARAGAAVAATDDPAADYAILPTTRLAARAGRDVKVVLTGEGGDEFFGGYGRYRAGARVFPPRLPNRPGPALRAGLLTDEAAAELRSDLARQAVPSWRARLFDNAATVQSLQRYDIDGWLPDNLLIKADRCLMRHGVEGRTPFIDRELSAFGFNLAKADKIKNRTGKYILKSWLAEHLPASRPFTPKRGFTVPVGEWIARNAAHLAEGAARCDAFAGVVKPDAIAPLFADAGRGNNGLLAWRILYYALWHRIHVRGADAGRPVVEILSRG